MQAIIHEALMHWMQCTEMAYMSLAHAAACAGQLTYVPASPQGALVGSLCFLQAIIVSCCFHPPAGSTITTCRATGSSADLLRASCSTAAICSCGSGGLCRLVVAHQIGTPAAFQPQQQQHSVTPAAQATTTDAYSTLAATNVRAEGGSWHVHP
jgi:hypothetical protein